MPLAAAISFVLVWAAGCTWCGVGGRSQRRRCDAATATMLVGVGVAAGAGLIVEGL